MPPLSVRRKAPEGYDLIRVQLVNRLAHEKYLPCSGGYNAADGHQCGGFTGSVGADQGDDLPFGYLYADPF